MTQYHANTFEVKNVRACDSDKQRVVYIINDIRSEVNVMGILYPCCLPREITQKCSVINKAAIDTRGASRGGVSESASARENYTPPNIIFNKKQNSTKHRHLLHYNQFLRSPLRDYLLYVYNSIVTGKYIFYVRIK